MENDQEASSSSGGQGPPSKLMFKERSEAESERLQLKWGGDEQLVERARQILVCVFRGQLELLKTLMEDVESVNIALKEQFDGGTPLIVAAVLGHVEIVKWIRDTRPERNMNAMDNDGLTPLSGVFHGMYSSEVANNVMTELLLAEDILAEVGELDGYMSLLHRALCLGTDWSVIHRLLEWTPKTGPPIDVDYRTRSRQSIVHCAAIGGNANVIDELLKTYPTMDVGVPDRDGWLPLHYAARQGRHYAVQKFLVMKPELVNAPDNEWRLTPLHFAVLSNNPDTVEAILKAGGKDLKVDQGDWQGSTPLDYARSWYLERKVTYKGFGAKYISMTRENARIMVQMLEGFDIQGLRTERQVYVDSANAILVGGALIASVTFSSWLQPPLGLTSYYDSQFLMPSPAPPDTYESFVGIKDHWTIEMFWIFNTLSFFFAVATIIGGADAALPQRGKLLKDAVRQVQHAVLRACCLLVVSMICVIGAFASAGFTVLPPLYKYQKSMIGSVCVGGLACVFVLWKVVFKIFSWTSLEEIREDFTSFMIKIQGYFSIFRKMCSTSPKLPMPPMSPIPPMPRT